MVFRYFCAINRNVDMETKHMGWRGSRKNYCWAGTYHITMSVMDRSQQPLGHIVGDVSRPDGDPLAPRVVLSEVGEMVEQELMNSIHSHYPMIEVHDHVVMPDHLHFIVVVKRNIVSANGRETHLGQVIAGFKKGCNRRYWELTGQAEPAEARGQGEPAEARGQGEPAEARGQGEPAEAGGPGKPAKAGGPPSAVIPQRAKTPSNGTTGRPPLFSYGYVDVMPLQEGQLERQRDYIRNNPRYRLMRQNNPKCLLPQRASVMTALTLPALKGYLQRECGRQYDADNWETISQRLLTEDNAVVGDSYGNLELLKGRLLPVVCHRKDAGLFEAHKARCLDAAAAGAVLVSAQIAKGEQDIIHTAIDQGFPVVRVEDNGFPSLYHPSEQRIDLCSGNKLLIVSPWQYAYRRVADAISVMECKTMNCVVQALCRTKDSWWKL